MEKSLVIIRRWSESYFDPNVVDAFFDIQEEILSIKAKYSEDNPQSFDIPDQQVLLQEYKHKELGERPGSVNPIVSS